MKILISEQQFDNITNLLLEAKASKYKEINYPEMDDKLFNRIVSFDDVSSDINNNEIGKYAMWLLKIYDDGESFNLDATKLIKLFDKYHSQLEKKDIFQYKNLMDLDFDLAYVEKIENKKELLKKNKEKYDVVYEDNEWIIVIPRSMEASIHWGRGANWCTSYDDEDNQFMRYYPKEKGGPLYYNINKLTGEKYSFHSTDGIRDKDGGSIKDIQFPKLPEKIVDFYLHNFSNNNLFYVIVDSKNPDIQNKAWDILLNNNPNNDDLRDLIKYLKNPDIKNKVSNFLLNNNPDKFSLIYIIAISPDEDIQNKALNILLNKIPNNNDLVHVIIGSKIPDIQIRTWNILKNNKPSNNILTIIIMDSKNPDIQKQAWDTLMKKGINIAPMDLLHIIRFSNNSDIINQARQMFKKYENSNI